MVGKGGEVVNEVDIRGYAVKGFVACINNQKEYYRINMLLKDYKVAFNLFKSNWPIYTHTNNSSPSIFGEDSDVTASVVANGCGIEGTVKNSIISRNVKVGRDAVIENSIVLPGAAPTPSSSPRAPRPRTASRPGSRRTSSQ